MAKTGKACTICSHPKRHQIEIGLVHRVSQRVLARRFGCSEDALQRHRHNHLRPAIAAAILVAQRPSLVDLEALQKSESEGILSQLVTQRARLQTHSDLASELGDVRSAVACERAITGNLELVARLLGTIVQRHSTTHTNILISADYLKLRQTIVETLRGFPDAAKAVGAALYAIEADAARDITERKQPLVLQAEAMQ